jgi:hypothetical protein
MLNDSHFKAGITKREDKENIIQVLKEKLQEFELLLEKAEVEEDIQKFLNENPLLIQPHSKKIPKQKLGEDWVTDFVLINILDQGHKYTFIEIEKSDMPILTKNNEFPSKFKHAEKQILDWDNWLQNHLNYIKSKLKGFEYPPEYLIIGGRSKNMTENKKQYIKAFNRKNDITFLTYDDVLKRAEEFIKNLENNL